MGKNKNKKRREAAKKKKQQKQAAEASAADADEKKDSVAAPEGSEEPAPGNGNKTSGGDSEKGDVVAEKEESAESEAPSKTEDATKKQEPEPSVPEGLEASLDLFTEKQKKLTMDLCSKEANQRHLFANWPVPRTESTDKSKRRLMAQLEQMDDSYPSGGLMGYIENARDLLDKSKRGVNPLEGWKPSVPDGKMFDVGTKDFDDTEKVGLNEVGKCGFVLVAGGLGERLGYGDLKIKLPTELATETSYIQFYIQQILAFEEKYAQSGQKLPLCIMTSGDTNEGTVDLLEKNKNFGMDPDQITIVQQGEGVPALENNDAKIALDANDMYKVQAKPHGHGDIHALLYSHGVAKKWLDRGISWAIFFQDTNGLAFHTLPLALGVSSNMGLVMNSIAIPRKAKQAIGGIAKLRNDKGQERTINVEYNQLDPLLRSSGFPKGDVNDDKTGFSPFPGNINQLVFSLPPYTKALERTKGVMPEFVNPKYKDEAKQDFKKPTRLECMMQDFPTVLEGADAEKVGFTCISPDICFSPVKNAVKDGVALQQKGIQPGVAASGEADQYGAIVKFMRSIGCRVEEAAPATFSGITVVPGPEIVLKPNFVSCPAEYKDKFPTPSAVKISSRSSLVVEGDGAVIKSLDLDGALVIKCENGASGEISGLTVKNQGWNKVADEASADEVIRMRGYRLEKLETRQITFNKDGSIEGDYSPEQDSSIATSKEKSSETQSPTAEADATKESEDAMKESEGTPSSKPTPEKVDDKAPTSPSEAISREIPDLSQPAARDLEAGMNKCGRFCAIS